MSPKNASISTSQPVHYRPMFGSFGSSLTQSSITFVSKAALALGIKDKFALKKQVTVVKNIRQVRKADMIHNGCAPAMQIDAQSYEVRADGELLTCEAATVLPMAQRYFLF